MTVVIKFISLYQSTKITDSLLLSCRLNHTAPAVNWKKQRNTSASPFPAVWQLSSLQLSGLLQHSLQYIQPPINQSDTRSGLCYVCACVNILVITDSQYQLIYVVKSLMSVNKSTCQISLYIFGGGCLSHLVSCHCNNNRAVSCHDITLDFLLKELLTTYCMSIYSFQL